MDYKVKCPDCGTKLSRWRYFTSASIQYRCPACRARFGMTGRGLAIYFGVAAVQSGMFALGVSGLISPLIALDVIFVMGGLAVWLLPMLTPVRAAEKGKGS